MVAVITNRANRREGGNVGRGAHPTAPEGGRAPRDLRFRASVSKNKAWLLIFLPPCSP